MIGRTNVGGGAGLNFKVVGGTSAPASPKENTIWVNTDDEITGWVFSAKRPIDIVDSYFVSDNQNQYTTALMVEADLKPDTTYTMTFEGVAGQKFYVNENFAGYKVTTVTSGRNTVTFTTNSELSAASANQYVAGYGWVVLKNHNMQTSAPVFNKLRIVEGDKDIDPSGIVWISTGTSSTAGFNALKKNSIQVCPLSAKQYIGGSWEDRTAKSYLGGAWSAWGQWLYNAGVWSNGSALTETYTNQSHTLTYNAGDIRAICSSRHDAVYTAFALTEDLTAWNQLCVKFTANEAYTALGTELGYAAVRLQAATGTHHNTGVAVKGQMNMAAGGTYTLQLDISQLEGDHYIHLLFYNYGTDGSKVDVNIQEVWLQ